MTAEESEIWDKFIEHQEACPPLMKQMIAFSQDNKPKKMLLISAAAFIMKGIDLLEEASKL